MLKVNNKKVISDLAKLTYKANRKRNILAVIAIFLTTFLICTVISIGISYWETLSLRQQRMEGIDYDIELNEPKEEQVSIIQQLDNVKYAGLNVKCAIISNYENRISDKIRLFWLDDTCWEKQTIPALESYIGNYPQKENELMLSKDALNSMGIKNPEVGMELPLVYQTLSEEKSKNNIEKNFVLSGLFLDYTGSDKGYVSEAFYKTTGVHQTDLTQGTLKISLKNPLYSKKDIVEMQNKVKISGNQIINADYDTISNFCKTIIGLLVLLLLVFFSAYLFIYNTLYISVNQDIRYYGQLKTLGTTTTQLKKLIYKQILWNSSIGIPLGLIVSAIVGKFIIPQVLHAVNPTIRMSDVDAVSIWVFAVASMFSLVTTLISSQKPAKIAMNCSPIEALRYIGIVGKVKQRNTQGGDIYSMARQNLLRDKKQFFVIMISLSLAVSLFLIINVVIFANNAKNILDNTYDYDLRILNKTLLTDKEEQVITDGLIKEIKNIKGVKDVRIVKSTTGIVPYQENVYGEYYKELYSSRYSPGDYEEGISLYKAEPDNGLFTCRIIGIDDLEFDKLNQEANNLLDKEAFKNGEIAFVSKSITEGDDGIPGKTVTFSLPEGLVPNKEESIKIKTVLEDSLVYYAGGYTPNLIISNNYLKKLLGNPLIELINIDYDESFSKSTETSIQKLVKDNQLLSMDSKLARYSEMKNSENQITVLGNSIGIIIMLLAILNYTNMMSASIQNRSKEFAILESIGMTRKQIKKMVTLESLGYGGLSILISLLIGLPVSYFTFNSFNIYKIPFAIPMMNNLILFLVIIIACISTSLLILNKSNNETIIELLRKSEN
ncbi:ABC transporter permease [Clostridioides difficile]